MFNHLWEVRLYCVVDMCAKLLRRHLFAYSWLHLWAPFFLCSSAKYATYIQYIWNPVLKETCKSCSDTNSITWSHFIRYSSIYHLGKHNWILLYSTVVLSEMLDLWTIASCFIEPLLNNLFFFQAITKLSLRMTWIHGLGYFIIAFHLNSSVLN